MLQFNNLHFCFLSLQVFTGVFGCGAATARKWYDKDMRSLEDVIGAQGISLNTNFQKSKKKGMYRLCQSVIRYE